VNPNVIALLITEDPDIWNGAYFLKTKDGQEFGYNPDGTRWKPVLEASDYDGLEDADEFGDHYHEECYNCGDRYDLTQLRENIRYCQNCERKYCTKCAEREEFVWRTAEQLGINHTYPETLLIAYCPACSGPAEHSGHNLQENWRRRDFLKTMGSAATTPNNIVSMLTGASDKYAQAIKAYRQYKAAGFNTGIISDVIFDIANGRKLRQVEVRTTVHGRPTAVQGVVDQAEDGQYNLKFMKQAYKDHLAQWVSSATAAGIRRAPSGLHNLKIPDNLPVEVVIGQMLDESDSEDPADLMNRFILGDASGALNDIPGFEGFKNHILQAMIKKFSFKDIIASLQKDYANENIGIDDQFWVWLHDLLDLNPNFMAQIGMNHQQLEKLRGTIQGAGALMRKGIVNKEAAQTEIKNIQQSLWNRSLWSSEFREKRKREKEEYQKREEERKEKEEAEKQAKKPEELEQYNIPGDYKAASPMHQWFENRVRLIANLITENPDISLEVDASMDKFGVYEDQI
jgi:hypothetical protein